eukprot:Em0253g7a
MKRSASHVEIEPEPEGEVEVKRKVVSLKTFQKWRTEMDRDLKTISWLSSSEAIENGKKIVKELKCSVCAKFRIQIMSRRNFSDYWITGASSIRTSNIRDHAKSDQHLHAMSLFQRERFASNGPSSSTAAAPIVVALTTLQDDERARLRKKMDVAYFVAKEKMSFHPDTEHYLYQSQELKNFTAATLYYTNHAADICERVVQCMRTRLAWTELQLLRDIIFILATSNGKVERVFSQMKEIKRNKRSLLSNETLDDLLLISTAEISMTQLMLTQLLNYGGTIKYEGQFAK